MQSNTARTNKLGLRRLAWEYNEIISNPIDGVCAGPVSEDNLYVWEAVIRGPEDSPYAFGCFTCELRFPSDYPINPPVMTFTNKLWHPNVYPDGKVCISILHKDDDPTGYEKRSERWTPVLSIGKVLLSVMSMLAQPNDESPANVDAASQWRKDRPAFLRRVEQDVMASLNVTPEDLLAGAAPHPVTTSGGGAAASTTGTTETKKNK
eukprot:INCI15734.3.p1 GENE.INCI15734.3~~INCI15734.3.p1  ORF type:complete len:207 (+),score=30.05 INCI15734.3:173-793(+)